MGLEEFTNDVWSWFILSIDLVSVTFHTIPTSICFSREKVFKILVYLYLLHRSTSKCQCATITYVSSCKMESSVYV